MLTGRYFLMTTGIPGSGSPPLWPGNNPSFDLQATANGCHLRSDTLVSLIMRNSLLGRDPTTLIYRLLRCDYCAGTSQDGQVKRTRASRRLVHSQIAPDNRIVFVEGRRSKAFRLAVNHLCFIPQFFDALEATFCQSEGTLNVFGLLLLDPSGRADFLPRPPDLATTPGKASFSGNN
jgi:hypothetical protein